jgi:mannose-1-phosphate guanylyltransferase/mannose-6-phosphate isomerase
MSDAYTHIYPVLLAGGTGSRLWPVSRELYPKQLVKFIGNDSLVQSTIKRLPPSFNWDNIRIVCGKEHFYEIARHMEIVGLQKDGKIISEPCGRNTAPAILLSLFSIIKEDADAIVCVFPADHVIRDLGRFHEIVKSAIILANKGHIVTFGIQPNYPETGYGYIEGGSELSEGALELKRFVEKPDFKTAKEYISAGKYFWNSGMFTFNAAVMIEEFKRFQPKLYKQMDQLNGKEKINSIDYEKLPNISLDYAVMEKTEKGVVLPSDFGWSDIGSWKSLYDFIPKDGQNNVIDGDVLIKDTENCFIMGHERLIATNCLKNLAIIETPDAVFVSDLENSRDVKEIVAELKTKKRTEYQQHRTVHYAWGSRTILERKNNYIVYRNILYPGSGLQINSGVMTPCNLTLIDGTVRADGMGFDKQLDKEETITVSKDQDLNLENTGNDAATIIQIEFS